LFAKSKLYLLALLLGLSAIGFAVYQAIPSARITNDYPEEKIGCFGVMGVLFILMGLWGIRFESRIAYKKTDEYRREQTRERLERNKVNRKESKKQARRWRFYKKKFKEWASKQQDPENFDEDDRGTR
jgi:hypothetical protein